MRGHFVWIAFLVGVGCTHNVDGVSIRGGNDERRAAVAQAVHTAEAIWRDDGFWALVERHWWLPAPGAKGLDGFTVHRTLGGHQPISVKYRLVVFFGWKPWHAFHDGESSPCKPIDLLARWLPTPTLVDTVAHENVHAANATGDCKKSTFLDESDDNNKRYDRAWLASYGVGDLAECYANNAGDVARTESCFEQNINRHPGCRTFDRCCLNPDSAPKYIKDIRSAAPECADLNCDDVKRSCEWHGGGHG